MSNIQFVTSNVAFGSRRNLIEYELSTIDYIINASGEPIPTFNSIKCIDILMSDKILSKREMYEILTLVIFISKYINSLVNIRKNVLVICQMGINRSPLLVGSYLLLYTDIDLDECIMLLRKKNNYQGRGALTNISFRIILFVIYYWIFKHTHTIN